MVSDLHYTLVPVSGVFKAPENVRALHVSQTVEVVRILAAGREHSCQLTQGPLSS